MKHRTLAVWVLALLICSLAVTACGGNASGPTPTAIPGGDTSGSGSDSGQATPTAGAAKPTTVSASAKVGDAVTVGAYTIAISEAKIDSDLLKVTFSVDNTKGDKDAIVPAEGFSATDPTGAAMTTDLVCSVLPVKIPAGKKVDGPVCWAANGAKATTGMKVRYNPGRTGGKIVNWDLP